MTADPWPEAKRTALERDSRRCVACTATSMLDVHHRRARGMGGSSAGGAHRLSNLVTLCRRCHDHVEAHPVRARELGLRLDPGQEPAEVPVWCSGVLGTSWVRFADDGTVTLLMGDAPVR